MMENFVQYLFVIVKVHKKIRQFMLLFTPYFDRFIHPYENIPKCPCGIALLCQTKGQVRGSN